MRKNLLMPLALSLLFVSNAYGQKQAQGQICSEGLGQNSATDGTVRGDTWAATHRFRQLGEKIEIPVRGDGVPPGLLDCEPMSLELHWANGRNNGSNFNVTFLDGNNTPVFARQISAFLTGVIQFPLSSFETQTSSSLGMIGFPAIVTIQAVAPFAAPANLSYRVLRAARASTAFSSSTTHPADGIEGNEVVSIRNTVRLTGGSRLPVVQLELKTNRPFPLRDEPVQLQIGKNVFVDELSGDYTGRKLTLILTPDMFSELTEGDEIMAFFGKPNQKGFPKGDVWHFGKLIKSKRQ